MNGEEAATQNGNGDGITAGAAQPTNGNSGFAAAAFGGTAAPSAATPPSKKNEQTPPKLTGKYEIIKPVVEPQRTKLQ